MSMAVCDYALAEGRGEGSVAVDKTYYFETFIRKPMCDAMRYIIGSKEAARILDKSNYTRVETVSARRGNLLAFFGKDAVTTRVTNKRPRENEEHK
jgi:hypothetical protein